MLTVFLVLATACASLPGASAAFTRANPAECVSEGEVNLVTLISALNDTVVCDVGGTSCSAQALQATDFTIEYFPSFKLVTNRQASPPYISVLYPCGTARPDFTPSGEVAGVAFFEIPLTAVGSDDSTAGWAMEFLDVADRVRFAPTFATAPCLQKVGAPLDATFGGCDRLFAGPGNFQGLPPTPLMDYDAQFLFGSYDPALKQVPFTASADPLPLGRAEHIVYMAAFFNKEADAARLLTEITADYVSITTAPTASAPTVAWVSQSSSLFGFTFPNGTAITGSGYIFSYASYKTTIARDAGANQLPVEVVAAAATDGSVRAADSTERGREIAFSAAVFGSDDAARAALLPLLEQVDILIDETFTFDISLASFLDTWGIDKKDAFKFPFIARDALYRHDKAQTPNGADDWFGQAVIRPAVVLSDLRSIVSPDTCPGYETTFFRNVGQAEAVVITDGSDCEGLTCASFDAQIPLPIEALVGEAAMDGGDLPDGGAGSGGPAPPVGAPLCGAAGVAQAPMPVGAGYGAGYGAPGYGPGYGTSGYGAAAYGAA